MAAVAREAGVAHLPHAKTHKTREIAERQLAHGAVGLTVAKLGEAEVMVDAGFDDLFVAYPLVGEIKLTRLVALLDRARVRFTVDSLDGRAGGLGVPRRRGRRCDVVVRSMAERDGRARPRPRMPSSSPTGSPSCPGSRSPG